MGTALGSLPGARFFVPRPRLPARSFQQPAPPPASISPRNHPSGIPSTGRARRGTRSSPLIPRSKGPLRVALCSATERGRWSERPALGQRRGWGVRELVEGAVGVDRAGVVKGVEHKLYGDRVFVDVLVGDGRLRPVLFLVVVLEDYVRRALGSLEEAVCEGDDDLIVIGGDLREGPPARRVVAGVEPPYEPGIGLLLVAGVARVVPVGGCSRPAG